MQYDPIKQKISISPDEAKLAAYSLLYAMRTIRELAGLPLEPYEKDRVSLTPADHAQKGIIDAAKHLGFDIGPEWGNQYDLRKEI